MSDELFEKIKGVIVERLNVEPDQVRPESRFREDLKADSLDLVELVMELEDAFGLEISDEDAEKIQTVQDVIEYIEKHHKG
ncbi:acyl carrier protein [Brockia lithotrophica]|uniref:Acyl carrier protein n=1 Tax=Brockia lithotrophica TaxID=933949 RepID=A0A660KW02_9BACL|nr:acyl carrier protein [Brockia lithotrophica]RKQ83622.1 acyl carrier protein [Brockia lithotrophica]